MKDDRPRVLGLPATERELRLWRAFTALFAVIACVAAIAGVRSVYDRAEKAFGYDFYQFWLGGDALRAHQAAGRHGVLELYTDAAHYKLGAQYVEMARHASRRQRDAAASRSVVDTASSPFFYWVFSIVTPGDYDRDYRVYIVFSISCMVGVIAFLAWRLGYSIGGAAAALALATISGPVHGDYTVINFNFPDLAICCLYLLFREWGKAWNARHRGAVGGHWRALAWFTAAGILMGSLAAFKPNLILLPALLGVSGLVARRCRGVLAEAGGFAMGLAGAVAVSSWAFGGLSCWAAWGRVLRNLGSRPTMPSLYGNFSITRNIYEATGHDLVGLFSAIGIALAIGAIWLGRRRRGVSPPMPAIEFRHDLAIFGLAVSVTLLSSGLAWVHYPILLFPFLMLVASPGGSGDENSSPSRSLRPFVASYRFIAISASGGDSQSAPLPFQRGYSDLASLQPGCGNGHVWACVWFVSAVPETDSETPNASEILSAGLLNRAV